MKRINNLTTAFYNPNKKLQAWVSPNDTKIDIYTKGNHIGYLQLKILLYLRVQNNEIMVYYVWK
jgi:hypothetical protein